MTDLPPPPPPPPRPPLPPLEPWAPPNRADRRWPTAIGIVIVGLLLVSGVAWATREAGPSAPSHPAAWDPRVADLAAFVEHERGLPFDHPVFVDFLSPADYSEQTAHASTRSGHDKQDLERYADELRALGVASGPLDLGTALDQISDGGTLAFYSPSDQRVRVRGTTITVGLRVTLVHELTHALQDQRFDLQQLQRRALDDSASTALRGLAEGDALRVEAAYRGKVLSTAERSAYDEEYAGDVANSASATAHVPAYVTATFAAPYALGQPFAVLLYDTGGNRRVDEAFRRPPTTEEHLLDPASYLLGERSRSVDVRLHDGAHLLDHGPFGATSWYLVLAERLDPKVALEAALGWNGDDFAAVVEGGRTCVRAAFVGDTQRDEDQMSSALAGWAAAMPIDDAKAIEVDGHPGLVSCDPGASVDLGLTGRSARSLALPSLWGYLEADGSSRSLLPAGDRCYATKVVAGLTYAQVADPAGAAFTSDAFQQRLSDALSACR